MTSTRAVATNIEKTPKTRIGPVLLAGYLALYAATLLAMQRAGNFDVSEPLLVLAIVGIGFSVAAWLLTIGVKPLPYAVRQPRKELTFIAIYLLPVVAFITWGLGAIHRYIPADPADAFTLLTTKLLVFVVIPAAFMHVLFGYSFRQLAPMSAKPRQMLVMVTMSALLLGFQAVLGGGMRDIAECTLACVEAAGWSPIDLRVAGAGGGSGGRILLPRAAASKIERRVALGAWRHRGDGVCSLVSRMRPACTCAPASPTRVCPGIHPSGWPQATRS